MTHNASQIKRIGLMGPFGFGNLGDAAIQQAMIENIRRIYPDAKILGFSMNPEDTQKRHEIESYPIGRFNNWSRPNGDPEYLYRLNAILNRFHSSQHRAVRMLAWLFAGLPREILSILDASKTVRSLDYFIVSGGGQLDDYWGGAWHHPYTMLLWSILAKLRKVKLYFVSVGAGPIDQSLSRWFIKAALSLADYRSFRDEDSKQLIERIGFKRNDPVYPDLAQSLEIERYGLAQATHTERPLVGIGPMAYFDPRVWPERDQQVYIGYLTKLAVFIVWLLENNHDILLFTGEAVHDRDVIADLRTILAEHGIARTDSRVSEPPMETVDDLMPHVARVDLVVVSRFHGVLLSQLLNKPVLALSYHKKIDVLMADMGQADYCLQIKNFEVETLKERFATMAANCQAIKTTMALRTQAYRVALEAQYQRLFQDTCEQVAQTK